LRIYTRTGDDGSTGLLGGRRVRKDSLRIEALGVVDELNAGIGMAALHIADAGLRRTLQEIQSRLFDIGAQLAGGDNETAGGIVGSDISALERSIDVMTEKLPPLRAFILPGGSAGAAALHTARTLARKTERTLVHLSESESVPSTAIAYLNRLSDWLFTAARTANALASVMDVEWHPR
jgi:cob(I)alamin adenosyltransferase